jgi:hypothetical protein
MAASAALVGCSAAGGGGSGSPSAASGTGTPRPQEGLGSVSSVDVARLVEGIR